MVGTTHGLHSTLSAAKRLPLNAESSEGNAQPLSEVAQPWRPPDEFELSLNEFLPLPVPSIDDDFDADSPNESDEDYSDVLTKEEAAEIYLDWISEQDKSDVKMMAVMVFDTFMQRLGLTKRGAGSEVPRLLDKNEKTI